MEITEAYKSFFLAPIQGRYIALKHIMPLLKNNSKIELFKTGVSEKGKEIPVLKIGKGSKKVLAWSQMHGNESTTTKAVFDFLSCIDQKEVFQKEINTFIESYSVYLIPILNPDGAEAYTRENANGVDLNRDAKALTQKESKLLRELFTEIKPDLCLNLHDQRTIYGLETGNPATVSFLSPSANIDRTVTDARKIAMQHIVKMTHALQRFIPNQVGRYDDTFNDNCVGDSFTAARVPTILFEAGHYQNDYQRDKTREFIFYALLELFGITASKEENNSYKPYFTIPENKKNFRDIILRNVLLKNSKGPVSIAIQYEEELVEEKVELIPVIKEVGASINYIGHKEIDFQNEEILINSQQKAAIDEKVLTIHYKNTGNEINFQ
jgi:hypothetical protein|tara:strand:- start:145454 stop:146596 length:1143 start_codon:yes stop_codon:yes gene_type:complete